MGNNFTIPGVGNEAKGCPKETVGWMETVGVTPFPAENRYADFLCDGPNNGPNEIERFKAQVPPASFQMGPIWPRVADPRVQLFFTQAIPWKFPNGMSLKELVPFAETT